MYVTENPEILKRLNTSGRLTAVVKGDAKGQVHNVAVACMNVAKAAKAVQDCARIYSTRASCGKVDSVFRSHDALIQEESIGLIPKVQVHFWVRCFKEAKSSATVQTSEGSSPDQQLAKLYEQYFTVQWCSKPIDMGPVIVPTTLKPEQVEQAKAAKRVIDNSYKEQKVDTDAGELNQWRVISAEPLRGRRDVVRVLAPSGE